MDNVQNCDSYIIVTFQFFNRFPQKTDLIKIVR
jgi:hypothetical protein